MSHSILMNRRKKSKSKVVSSIIYLINLPMCFNIILNVFKVIDESTTNNNFNDNKSGMRSVLVYVRNKSSKKSVSWKQENDLVKVSYFEHDETERGIVIILF